MNKIWRSKNMDKFEYMVIAKTPLRNIIAEGYSVFGSSTVDYLNELGNEGWEVCGVDGNKYLLKRVKR